VRRAKDIVTREEFETVKRRLDAALEAIEDLKDLESVRRSRGGDAGDRLSADLVDRMIAGESRVRIWREQRRLSQSQLARRAKLAVRELAAIENGKAASAATLAAIGAALRIKPEALLPVTKVTKRDAA
jgi:DNA-binding XRE family transcriptional regulator